MYAFVITILSIVLLNKIFFTERRNLRSNPLFFISIAFILAYIYIQLVELFWLYSVKNDSALSVNIYNLYIYVNVFTYILYTYAILCMNRKLRFTQHS